MKVRTKIALWGALILIILAIGVLFLAPESPIGKGIMSLGIAFGAFGAFLAAGAKDVVRFLSGQAGSVEGNGDPWVPVKGNPNQIDVWANSETHRVTLPPGMTSEKIRAVKVVSGLSATVEVLP
jgi:hypothetical protein